MLSVEETSPHGRKEGEAGKEGSIGFLSKNYLHVALCFLIHIRIFHISIANSV